MNVDLATAAAWAVPFAPFGAAAAWAAWYKRTPKGCAAAALAAAQLPFTYRVRGATIDGDTMTVTVDTPEPARAWRTAGDNIAAAFNRARPSVNQTSSGVELRMLPKTTRVWDALKPWETTPPDRLPDLTGLPVARDVYGRPWRMKLLGAHILGIGATGAGKGSVLWSTVQQVAPGVHDGTVQLWGVDPKGGVELGFAEPMFHRAAFNGADPAAWEADLAAILNDARAVMDARLERMRGASRSHQPTPAEPLVVLIVDEFLTLTLGIADRAVRQGIERDLTMLLSKGRAAGVSVVAFAQLAQKDALSANLRDLFPTRVGLRMTDPIQVDMTLGVDARKAGAECHTIPDTHPGAAYVVGESGAPRLVRFPWVPDDAVRAMAREYAPRRMSRVEQRPVPAAVAVPADPAPAVDVAEPTTGEKITRLRGEHPDWSQARIATEIGVSKMTVSRWFARNVDPD